MDCSKITELAYNEEPGLFGYAQIRLHAFFCEECARKIALYNKARANMLNEFFPPHSEEIENSVMSRIADGQYANETNENLGGFSTRGWVITGLLIFISFIAAFLGMDFQNVANETGISFILPIGILFGAVLTVYCAMFIGSHLKKLTERFGL